MLVIFTTGIFYLLLKNKQDYTIPKLGNPIRFTSTEGAKDYPTWRPDGTEVTYESNQSGNLDIWVIQIISGRSVNRTEDHPGSDRVPAWSPNGDQIAFWSDRDGGGYFLMSALGGDIRKIIEAPSKLFWQPSQPLWASNSKKIACTIIEASGQQYIEIIDLKSQDKRKFDFLKLVELGFDINWSPNERFIAFVKGFHEDSPTNQLYILDLTENNSFPITDGKSKVWSPSWSQDGRFIYFSSDKGGSMDIWLQRIDEDGTPIETPQQITTTGLECRRIIFSRDQKKLLYTKKSEVKNIWTISLEGGPPKQITNQAGMDVCPSWSPDDSEIVFHSDRSGNNEIWAILINGGDARQITNNPANDIIPQWSPDGRWITFNSDRTGDYRIWKIPAAGGHGEPLTDVMGTITSRHRWSPDGKKIYFTAIRNNARNVWEFSILSKTERQLTNFNDKTGVIRHTALTTDGKYIYFVWEENFSDLWVMDVLKLINKNSR
ncbi:PD40 domain-containing protein [candidate division KSB1 bacterium]|nr:PD40 domain-containing protein [candidate division KSB1 bacterium]MBL7092475.1 PD40 domain-containing protein [candidate division KSB1 bacterium]